MTIFQAIIFGAVQGVTEFLPISSTAHLVLLPWLLGWPDPGLSFDVALHLGTLVALLVYFRKDWLVLGASSLQLVRGRTSDPNARMAMFIVAATIPGAVAGIFLESYVETALRSPLVIAMTLSVMAFALAAAEWTGRQLKDLDQITWRDAIAVGLAQAVALVPGVSRSGSTITAGLFAGMKRETAARFSFYLSAPIIAGAVAKKLFDIFQAGLPANQLIPFVAGIISAGVVGYLSIAFLLRYLQTHNTLLFVVYRIALAIVVLLAFWLGFR